MSFLKKVKIKAGDGPESKPMPSGASNPENWVTKHQTGKSSFEVKNDAETLHSIVSVWQGSALQAWDLYSQLMMNGGRNFELHSPILLQGMSRQKLQYIIDICKKFMNAAPHI